MTTYAIKISAEMNYWWDKEYRIQKTGVAAAIGTAMREFKKEERVKGKRIRRYKVEVSVLK